MKTVALTMLAVLLLGASSVWAQPWGWGGYWDSGASTVAESQARGMSDMIRSSGAANLMNSEAAINFDQARRSSIETQQIYAQTYFDMREMNRQARARERGPVPTSQDFIRFAQMGSPNRLTSSQLDPVTGALRWPMLLGTQDFADGRAELERAFQDRAAHGALSLDDFNLIRQMTEKMLGDLQAQISNLPPQQYMEARRFLESVRFEAGLAPT